MNWNWIIAIFIGSQGNKKKWLINRMLMARWMNQSISIEVIIIIVFDLAIKVMKIIQCLHAKQHPKIYIDSKIIWIIRFARIIWWDYLIVYTNYYLFLFSFIHSFIFILLSKPFYSYLFLANKANYVVCSQTRQQCHQKIGKR